MQLLESVANKNHFEHSGNDQLLALSTLHILEIFVLGQVQKSALKPYRPGQPNPDFIEQ